MWETWLNAEMYLRLSVCGLSMYSYLGNVMFAKLGLCECGPQLLYFV